MQITVFKDPFAIKFIRCLAAVPGTTMNAGGAGYTLPQAIVRCVSEVIERHFEIHELRTNGLFPKGIAAHFDAEKAREKALQESIETLCLDQIHSERRIRCIFKMRFGGVVLGVARTNFGYFSFIRGFLDGTPVGAYSSSRGFFSSLLKAWEEYQSMHFFKPRGELLKTFTKANIMFTEIELGTLPFLVEPKFIYRPNISALTECHAIRSGRAIAFFI